MAFVWFEICELIVAMLPVDGIPSFSPLNVRESKSERE